MLEAIVQTSLDVEIVESPVPTPGAGEVLIRVAYSGVNPKDWKMVVYGNAASNSGDDIAGVVERVGSGVFGFKQGDRVAAFHQMRTPHGSFAQYAIAPAHTTFHIPETVSFEEEQLLTWTGCDDPPRCIHGCRRAVSLLATHASVGTGHETNSTVRQSLKNQRLDVPIMHAFDTISEKGSPELVAELLATGPTPGHATFVLLEKDYSAVAEKVLASLTYVGYVHTGPFPVKPNQGLKFSPDGHGHDFGAVYSALFTRGLAEGWLTAHPFEVVPDGLKGISVALRGLKDGKMSGRKYVVRIDDTVTSRT